MTYFKSAVSAVALIVSSQVAQAADVSAAGASSLGTVFETYFGKGTQAVRVAPNGANDGYDVSLDLGRLMKPLEAAGVIVKPALVNFTLKPQADGTWAYSQGEFPAIDLTHPGGNQKMTFEGHVAKGVFDPKIASFSSYEGGVKRATVMADDKAMKISEEIKDIKATMTGKDAGGGGVNTTVDYTIGAFSESIESKNGDLPGPIKVGAASSTMHGDMSSLMSRAMLDLWAFFVAHPDKASITAAQDEMKAKILAALPLWKRLGFTLTANQVTIDTPKGGAKIARLSILENLNGAVPEGEFEIGIGTGAIELPAQLVPAWAVSLVPKESSIGVKLSGYNAEKLARAVVANLDLTKEKPMSLSDADAAAAILPNGTLNITLPPGKAVNDIYNITWEGVGQINPTTTQGSGKVKVTAKGLDAVAAKLSKVPDAAQIIAGIYAAKAMAKPVNGADVWEVEFDSAGKLTVNGQKLGG